MTLADRETSALFLQVDAPTEVMRQQLASGTAALAQFDARAAETAASVARRISTMGDQFGPFKQRVASAAQVLRQEFEAGFARVQEVSQRAIQAPRADGSVSLGAEQARAAAEAAARQVVVLRAVEDAVNRAAVANGGLTSAYGINLNAARAATIAAEDHARAAALEAGQLEALELELRRANVTTGNLGTQQRGVTTQSGAMRAGMQNLSYQISDMSVQLAAAAGSSDGAKVAFMAFTQQFPQAIQAVALMRAETTGFIGFMSGPWGAAITGAITLLGSLALAYRGAANDADAATNALDRLIKKRREEQAVKTQDRDAERDLNKLVERRAQLTDYIAKNGVKDRNGYVQFVAKQQAELADVNRQLYEARNAIDAERGRALGTPSDIAVQIERDRLSALRKESRASTASSGGGRGKSEAALEREAEKARIDELLKRFKDPVRDVSAAFAEAQGKAITQSTQQEYDAQLQLIERIRTEDAQARQRVIEDAYRLEERKVDFLTNLFEDGMRGGVSAIWGDFEQIGTRVISRVLAQFVAAQVSGKGGGFSFGSAFSTAITSVLGFSQGGAVQRRASGGYISGAGTATSDDIPAWLSDGEYVLRAAAVRRIGVGALDALNNGQTPRFAAGGLVSPRLPGRRAINDNAGGDGTGGVTIQINAPGATAETVAMIRRELANALPVIVQTATANTTRQLNRRSL